MGLAYRAAMAGGILVTGFEPFGGASENPTAHIIERLADLAEELRLVLAVLPVEYAGATERLNALIAEHAPAAVVCLGQAEGRAELSFERVAVNLSDAGLADNAGVRLTDQLIAPEGPAAHFTTLPVKAMVEAARAVGVPAGLSLSAGAFVCNHLFYQAQSALVGSGVRSGFVHVPLLPEQAAEFPGQPTLALEQQVRGLVAALRVLAGPVE